jgi:hypothetical protein
MEEMRQRLKLAIQFAAILITASIEATLSRILPFSGGQLPCCLHLSLESPMTADGHPDTCLTYQGT